VVYPTVTTQDELEEIVEKFSWWPVERVTIKGGGSFWGPICVPAMISCPVEATEGAHVQTYNQVEAYDRSYVEAYGHARVTAHMDSSVWAQNDVQVEAYDRTSIYAQDYVSVRATGCARVIARGRARVIADGHACVYYDGDVEVTRLPSHRGAIIALDPGEIERT
jgi:hypothetical protein